jgi:predicted MFS family arabinose efflux permease
VTAAKKLPFKKLLSDRFSALAHSNFRYFLSGQGISLLGTWMQRTAQQWLIYSLTDSAFLLGLLGVCQQLPILLFSLFSGVYIDKYPKKNILLFTQAFQMAQALIMAALVGLEIVEYWHIFILAALLGLSNTLDMPARQTFFIELVGRKDLKNAIGLNATVENTAKIVGPGLAGFIMAKYGVSFCFLLNGLSFIAVIYSLTKINHYDENIRTQQKPVMSEIIDGLKYIKHKDIIFYATVSTMIIGIFAMNTNVIFPVFARVTFSQQVQGFSFMLSAMGIGALIGSMVFAARSRNKLSPRSVLINALLLSGSLILAGSVSNYYIVLAVIAIIGMFNITFMTTVNSLLQLNSSDDYRGRVMSVYYLVLTGSSPIGNFATGYVAEHFGPANSFYLGGLISVGLTIIFFLSFTYKKKTKTLAGA